MKPHCKTLTISLTEIKINLKFFLIFIFISVILFSAVISIFGLALQIPAELTGMIAGSRYSRIKVTNLNMDDLEYMESFPSTISYYVEDLNQTQLNVSGIDPTSEENEPIQIQGNIQNWIPNNKNATLKYLNENILNGSPWTEQDNDISESGAVPIWLNEHVADLLSVKVGDIVKLYNKNGNPVVNSVVKGIYSMKLSILYSYFINVPTYEKLRTADDMTTVNAKKPYQVILSPYKIYNLSNIISELRKQYFCVSAEDDVINSLMYIIYTLYILTLFLICVSGGIFNTIIHLYFSKRRKYFGIYKAIGLNNNVLVLITFYVSQIIMTISFIFATLISPFINKYVINIINSLFDEVKINPVTSISSKLIIYAGITLLVFLICLINKKQYKSLDVLSILKQE